MSDARGHAPATGRNREPILEVLRRHVRPGANVLEIASGTGEHAVYLAPLLEVASWQPSDPSAAARASVDAWRASSGVASVLPALDLDVERTPWPDLVTTPDVVVCVNMIHISPWRAALCLLEGAAAIVAPGGLVYLYGPYRRGGHMAPSNEAFDASLRARNPEWGVRDLEAVVDAARERGLTLDEVVEMPANNLSVVLRRVG